MDDIYKDVTALPSGLQTLASQLKGITSNQKSFIIQHFMRSYVKNPALFDMVFEAKRISKEIENGTLIGSKNVEGEEKHDKFFLKSMEEQGYWVATAKDLVLTLAFNRGKSHKSTLEIIEEAKAHVEGSNMESKTLSVRIVNSILRLAGFNCKTRYRKETKDSARCWKLEDPTDTLEICLQRLNSKLTEELNIWEQ